MTMSKEQSVPKLRFPGFEGEWENHTGEELFTNRRTKGREGLPIYSVTLERKMVPRASLDRKIGDDAEDSLNLFVAAGDIAYNMMRMWQGAFGLATVDCMVSGAYVVLQPKSLVNSTFFTYSFSREEAIELFRSYSHGLTSDRLRLYFKDFALIAFNVPTLPEQTKIADFLTAVDERLQILKRKKALLEQYKKGMMQRLFSQELRFKDADGKDFPDWEERRLGEVTFKVDRKNKKREALPVYSISNQHGFIPQSDQFEGLDSNQRGYDTSLYKVVDQNTFVYNPARINVGSIGYSGELGPVIVSSLYVCFKTIDLINDRFLHYFIGTRHFQNEVLSKGEGGVRIYLFYENLSEITIEIPSLAEQTKIADFLSSLDAKIQVQQGLISRMETWKKGLLQAMFVG